MYKKVIEVLAHYEHATVLGFKDEEGEERFQS